MYVCMYVGMYVCVLYMCVYLTVYSHGDRQDRVRSLRLHSLFCPKFDFLVCLACLQEVVLKQVIAAILPQFAAIRGIPAFGAHAPAQRVFVSGFMAALESYEAGLWLHWSFTRARVTRKDKHLTK